MGNWIRSLFDKIAIRRRVRALRDIIVNWWLKLDSLFDKIAIRRRVRALRDIIVNWWLNLDAVPYVTVFDVPPAYALPDRSIGDIKGLLAVALQESAADRRV